MIRSIKRSAVRAYFNLRVEEDRRGRSRWIAYYVTIDGEEWYHSAAGTKDFLIYQLGQWARQRGFEGINVVVRKTRAGSPRSKDGA